MTPNVAIVGLGYVGLPLALRISAHGFNVIGIDIDESKVKDINDGRSYIEDITDASISKSLFDKRIEASSDFSKISKCKVVIICVPTPIGTDRKPDLRFLDSAVSKIGKYLSPATLVVLESTVQPGATRNYLIPRLADESGLNKTEFYVAFSPERIDPMNKKWNLTNIPKLISAVDATSLEIAVNFYSKFIPNLKLCDSLEIAECAKLLENSFRLVNISFINEFAEFCDNFEVDVNRVIDAAASKPYGFMPFYPGLGAGGHCIPVDPLYLEHTAEAIGSPLNFIKLAAEINSKRPTYLLNKIKNYLGVIKDKRILIVGIGYKPHIGDVRESPSVALIEILRSHSAIVKWNDDSVKNWNGEESTKLVGIYDLVIISGDNFELIRKNLKNSPLMNSLGQIL